MNLCCRVTDHIERRRIFAAFKKELPEIQCHKQCNAFSQLKDYHGAFTLAVTDTGTETDMATVSNGIGIAVHYEHSNTLDTLISEHCDIACGCSFELVSS